MGPIVLIDSLGLIQAITEAAVLARNDGCNA
jgi:hypothetical protein